jgi:hypothetical protein
MVSNNREFYADLKKANLHCDKMPTQKVKNLKTFLTTKMLALILKLFKLNFFGEHFVT